MADGIQAALENLKSQREEAAEEAKPEGEVVDVSQDTPEEETEEVVEVSETVELEDLDDDSESLEEGSEESQALIYDIDGNETTLAEILEWKAGHMKDADYRKKTMSLSDDRKAVEALSAQQSELLETLKAQVELLEASNVSEFEGIDWDDLRITDTAEYLRLKELQEAGSGKLGKAKASIKKAVDDKTLTQRTAANQALFELNPSWIEGGKPTEQYEADQKLLVDYVKANNFAQTEIDAALTSGPLLDAIIKAARLDVRLKQSPATTKKVRKAPTVVRGKKASVTGIQTQINEARAKLKQTGDLKDALALKKLERQA